MSPTTRPWRTDGRAQGLGERTLLTALNGLVGQALERARPYDVARVSPQNGVCEHSVGARGQNGPWRPPSLSVRRRFSE